ncbi:hypothetical protein QTP88_010129 [Uroleucon formosanum]
MLLHPIALTLVDILKEYNLKRHYMTNYSSKYDKYTGVARENVVIDLKRKLQTQQNVMVKATTSQQLSLMASYVISNEIAKSKKSLSDGEFIKNCAIKMAKSINENRIASEFEKISLLRRTVTRRIADTDSVIRETLQTIMMNCAYFSIALDESTDVSDVSQLLIFVRVISPQFEMYEELLELCSLHGSTKEIDIFNAVKNAFEPFGGFKKMSSVVTDGAKSMVGKNIGFVGLLCKSDINVPAIHCIIHQEALCGKIMKLDNIMNTVFKITNLIRGGNRSLNHRNFIKYLEELDCEYGDLLLHTDVRWLSRGKCLERFFDLRKEILNFLKTNITTDTTYFENQLVDKQFLCSLAFLTNISQHLNKLNLQLQGRKQTISQIIGFLDGFRKKLELFKNVFVENKLIHFPCCEVIKQEFDNEFNFEHCITHIDELIVEFKRRFEEIELMRPQINLFNNPMAVEIEKQDPSLQLELCELQTDPFLSAKEIDVSFSKTLPVEKYPILRDFALKMLSMFGTTYICECTFSNLKHIKSKERNRLTDETLGHLLRVSTTEIEVDFTKLSIEKPHPQVSH